MQLTYVFKSLRGILRLIRPQRQHLVEDFFNFPRSYDCINHIDCDVTLLNTSATEPSSDLIGQFTFWD